MKKFLQGLLFWFFASAFFVLGSVILYEICKQYGKTDLISFILYLFLGTMTIFTGCLILWLIGHFIETSKPKKRKRRRLKK